MLDISLDAISKKIPLFKKKKFNILEPSGQDKLHVVAQAQQ